MLIPTVNIHTLRFRGRGHYQVEVGWPVVVTRTPVSQEFNHASRAIVMDDVRAFLSDERKTLKTDPKFVTRWELLDQASFSLIRPTLMSASIARMCDTQGAHPMANTFTLAVGLVNGKPKVLQLRDLLVRRPGTVAKVEQMVMDALRKDQYADWVHNGTYKSLDPISANHFLLTPKGVMFLFDPYVVGPWAVGTRRVELTYASLQGLVDPHGPLAPLLR